MPMLMQARPRQKPIVQEVLREPPPRATGFSGATPDDIKRMRELAKELSRSGMDYSPVGHWTQGLARVAQGLVGGIEERRAGEKEREGKKSAQEQLAAILAGGIGDDDQAAMLEYGSHPYANEAISGELLKRALPEKGGGPFAGTSFDASSANILVEGQSNPEIRSSPQYALAWAKQTTPRVITDANGRSVLYTPPPPQGILPPTFGGQQASGVPSPAPVEQSDLPPPFAEASGDGPPPSSGATRTGPGGTTTPIPGMGRASKPLTEGQSKDIGFYSRMVGTSKTLDDPATVAALTDVRSAVARGLLPQGVANFLVTKENRKAMVAANEWLFALLRKDTGAAVTEKEFDLYTPTYIPQAGDDEATITRKKEARARAKDGLRKGLSGRQILESEGIILPEGFDDNGNEVTGQQPEQFAPTDAPLPPQDGGIIQHDENGDIIGGTGGPQAAPVAPAYPSENQRKLDELTPMREKMNRRHKKMLMR